ncbi:MAG: phenylacetate--CoA ligase family protein [Betaproteobacteria bacterium]|nr:phenylacetate--CoA ligase family protein [Betaproteobacteria bacterium]
MPLPLPKSRREIAAIQSQRKVVALAQARRAPFFRGKLDHIDAAKLDDPDEWRKIPILDKDMLRAMPDTQFYADFCVTPADGIAEYWRSGGSTGKPLFYPRSHTDIRYGLLSFKRTLQSAGCVPGDSVHVSFPLGIHPVGQIFARCAGDAGIAVNWAGAGNNTSSAIQLELIQSLKPSVWMGMSSYGLHLANLADARGIDLAHGSVNTLMCSAEPLSEAKRLKMARMWGARVFDNFGMTEAGMMGGEDGAGVGTTDGFRIWTDMYLIEVLDPDTFLPVNAGEVGTLVVTPLWTNNVTPFLRWSSGDLVVYSEADDGAGPFSVFPRIRHTHRTTGFFKVRGVNINHSEFEDFVFRAPDVNDFKCELVNSGDLDQLRLSIELRRGADADRVARGFVQLVKDTFEVTPELIVLEPGTLAREFESSIKAPRFADKRA